MSLLGINWFQRRRSGLAALIDVLYVLGALGALIASMVLLGALGFGTGLDYFPIGEDNTWIDLLGRGPGATAAHLAWKIDHRNPLSPWWYIAARSFILDFDAGLFILKLAISLILALSAYCMILAVAGRASRAFALGLAMLVVFWMPSRYTDQIIWNFQGALAASLFSIAAYARLNRSTRCPYYLYAASIVMYFVAFATYTLQCGAVLAIAYLRIRRDSKRLNNRKAIARLGFQVLADTSPYLFLFIFFVLIWRTTMGSIFTNTISFDFALIPFLTSLREGAWSSDFALLFSRSLDLPEFVPFTVAAAACSLLTFFALLQRNRCAGVKSSIITPSALIDIFVVVACVAAPTILIESTTTVWAPGDRWPMIYQLTTPVFVLTSATLVLVCIMGPSDRRYGFWAAFVSLAAGLATLLSLGYNQAQQSIVHNEIFVRDSLIRVIAENLAAGRKPPGQVLIMLDEASRSKWRALDVLSPVIARVWTQRDDTSFRLVPWFAAPSLAYSDWWTIHFGSDSDGVRNARVGGGTIPYSDLAILEIEKGVARRVFVADREDFTGWKVGWQRNGRIILPSVEHRQFCPVAWIADQDALMTGWSVRENDERGPVRWTTSRSARLTLPSDCRDLSTLRVIVAYAVTERNLENLALHVNGHALNTRRFFADGNIIYESELPPNLASSSIVNIDFLVDSLDAVPGAKRQFGVAVRRIEVFPLGVNALNRDP